MYTILCVNYISIKPVRGKKTTVGGFLLSPKQSKKQTETANTENKVSLLLFSVSSQAINSHLTGNRPFRPLTAPDKS